MNTDTPVEILESPIQFLLVEDSDIDAEAIRRVLNRTLPCWSLTRATNGEEALEIMLGTDTTSALEAPYTLLLDLNMPRMDGFQLLETLQSMPMSAEAPVFVMSSSTRAADIEYAYQFPVCNFIEKPLNAAALEHLVLASTVYHAWHSAEIQASKGVLSHQHL